MPRVQKPSPAVAEALQNALNHELKGVILYTHLALRVFGPQMHGIVSHLRSAAAESLSHAESVGDRMTTIGAVPHVRVEEDVSHSPRTLQEVLQICLVHERQAVDLYRGLLEVCGGDVTLEEFAREMIVTETEDAAGLEKLMRPMG